MKKVCLVSLGCPKNLVDGEAALALLAQAGFAVTPEPDEADLVIVNTCAFLRSAVAEAQAEIRAILSHPRPGRRLVAAGCLAQRDPAGLLAQPGVDGVVGTGDPRKVAVAVREVMAGRRPEMVAPGTFRGNRRLPRLVSTFPYAYLKIAEGCSNNCSYCLIPSLRGTLRSRSMDSVVREAEVLAAGGAHEIVLVAQDTTAYGRDRSDGASLARLIRRLGRLAPIWIRILYAHPANVDDHLLDAMAQTPNVCRYLDLPLQHVHPTILRRMRRPVIPYGRLIEHIRTCIPSLRLRTTFMVGFPGETAAHFASLRDFVAATEFDRLGVFVYSREEHTDAASIRPAVPYATAVARAQQLLEMQRAISRRRLRRMVGTEVPVLIDQVSGGIARGRTEFDAPEIDGVVRLPAGRLRAGNRRRVLITRSTDHDLAGRDRGPWRYAGGSD